MPSFHGTVNEGIEGYKTSNPSCDSTFSLRLGTHSFRRKLLESRILVDGPGSPDFSVKNKKDINIRAILERKGSETGDQGKCTHSTTNRRAAGGSNMGRSRSWSNRRRSRGDRRSTGQVGCYRRNDNSNWRRGARCDRSDSGDINRRRRAAWRSDRSDSGDNNRRRGVRRRRAARNNSSGADSCGAALIDNGSIGLLVANSARAGQGESRRRSHREGLVLVSKGSGRRAICHEARHNFRRPDDASHCRSAGSQREHSQQLHISESVCCGTAASER